MPRTRKANYSEDPVIKTRGPSNSINYDFVVKEIQSNSIKIKDVLGHLVYLKKDKPKAKQSIIAKELASFLLERASTSDVLLSERWLTLKIEEAWKKYLNYMKSPKRYQETRIKWYENEFLIHPVEKQALESNLPDKSTLESNINEESFIEESNIAENSTTEAPPPPETPTTPATTTTRTTRHKRPSTQEEPTAKKQKRNTTNIDVPCMIAMRYGIDPYKAAALTTATLVSHKIVTREDTSQVIDRQKFKRQTDKLIKKKKEEGYGEFHKLTNVYFDSKKAVIGRHKENLYVFLTDPDGKFICCEVCEGEGADETTAMFINAFKKRNIPIHRVRLLGVDGTNLNTGWENGIIRQVEEYLEHAVQWIVCLLHTNELPLRKLFIELDGATTGPSTYSGPLGRIFTQKGYLNTLSVANFGPVLCDALPELDRELLSKDQQHLYDLHQAVRTGNVSRETANRVVGTVHHARFLNLAASILRYYVSQAKPSLKLKCLVYYVMKCYCPMYFSVKCHSKIFEGAKNLFNLFRSVKQGDKYELLLPVILNNSYFWHPENMLIAMLCDDDQNVRRTAVQRITTAREAAADNYVPGEVRVFLKLKRSQINEEALVYYDVIKWDILNVTEPPILSSVGNFALQKAINDPNEMKKYLNYSNHTQQVERAVKDLAYYAARHPPEDRDAVIKLVHQNRKQMSSFRTKQEYNVFEVALSSNLNDIEMIDHEIDSADESDTDLDLDLI